MYDVEAAMRVAIKAARRNEKAPFGSVIVRAETGEIVVEGHNQTTENPLLHGEIDAIRRLNEQIGPGDWSAFHLITTAEPCCVCQGAIVWSGISAVHFGVSIAELAKLGWRQIDLDAATVVSRASFAECRIAGGILRDDCEQLFRAAKGSSGTAGKKSASATRSTG